jgi:hypothetical protein
MERERGGKRCRETPNVVNRSKCVSNSGVGVEARTSVCVCGGGGGIGLLEHLLKEREPHPTSQEDERKGITVLPLNRAFCSTIVVALCRNTSAIHQRYTDRSLPD